MRAGRAAGIVLTVTTVTMLQATPAQATEEASGLQFSTDGVSYSPVLAQPVLQSAEPIAPGGSMEAPVWVRNNNDADGWLSVAALAGTVDVALEQELRVRAATEKWTGTQEPLGKSGACSDLAAGLEVPAGGSVRLTFDLAFDIDAPNNTRQQSADFALRFLLQGSGGGNASGACADPRAVVVPGVGSATGGSHGIAAAPYGSLADTGASVVPWLTGGAAAVAVGAIFVGLTKRRERKELL